MFCTTCGQQLNDDAVFCTNCGAMQKSAAPEPEYDPDDEKTVGIYRHYAHMAPPQQEPVCQEPPQPVYQAPQQPTYQAPEQPAYQAYQAPQQPYQGYQQQGYQQSAYSPNQPPHNGRVGFGEAIGLFFKNYANFSGRASRSEYWWAFLFNWLVNIVTSIMANAIPAFPALVSLVLLIPGLSLAVRRLHDVGKSGGWWFMGLIPFAGPIILLIQYLKDSDGDNQWGPGPV